MAIGGVTVPGRSDFLSLTKDSLNEKGTVYKYKYVFSS